MRLSPRLRVLSAGFILGAFSVPVVEACGPLTPASVTAIEAGDAAACAALSALPVAGPVIGAACPGEEALLAAALTAVLASQGKDAGAATATAKAAMLSSEPAVAVHQRRAGKRAHVGYVSAPVAPFVQAELDKGAT